MSRWSPEEASCLSELRFRLKDEMSRCDPLPDGEIYDTIFFIFVTYQGFIQLLETGD